MCSVTYWSKVVTYTALNKSCAVIPVSQITVANICSSHDREMKVTVHINHTIVTHLKSQQTPKT